jgi:hypothetical protein
VLDEKEQKMLEMYEKQLSMPRVQYIILYGVLVWGLSLLTMMSLVDYFIFKKSFQRQWDDGLIFRILLMPVAGIFFGWYMRRLSEKKMAKLKEKAARH